ncbi:transcription factor RFX3-like [Phalacrocorax aristotelis]|uniref:transcription factor RFX3-like n=1 Tax=Phalacrocorax aristotelis TaxID=126867 RepID=UPI003F4B43DA
MGLRTRRLGTRGNSKYHYYGIRVKPDSPLNRLQEDMQYMAMRQQPMQQKQRCKPVQKADGVADGFTGSGQQTGTSAEQTIIAQRQHHQQFLDASRVLPEFGEVEISSLPDGTTLEDIKSLQSLYREHCEAIVDVVVNLQFSLIEKLWQTFWRYSPSAPADDTAIIDLSNLSEIESRLPKGKLITLCKNESILKWMGNCDHVMYQALVEILIPDVLRPIPSALTQAIRNFAKSLEGWLSSAMNNIPQRMIQTKVAAVSAFAQTLRRYTSLNHLAQAARAVLQNTSQINQMLSDLNRVDFANVQVNRGFKKQTFKKLLFPPKFLILIVISYYSIKKAKWEQFVDFYICSDSAETFQLHFGHKENKTSDPLSISIFSEGFLSFRPCILPIFI